MNNLSNFLTTMSCSLNVFIYLLKHRQLVVSLVFPRAEFQQLPAIAVSRRRRSSWLLYRMSSSPNLNNGLRLFTRNPNLEVCL